MLKEHPKVQGFTLIELLTVTAIGSLLLGALILLVGRSFQISREQLEQVRITEDARLQIGRMAETIRNSRPITCGSDVASWLEQVGEYNLQILTNVDGDEEAERVQYYVDPGDTTLLKQKVTELNAACVEIGTPIDRVLIRSLQNQAVDPDKPLFEYYPWGGSSTPVPISGETNTADIGRIGINLIIDISNQAPTATNISTQVTIRSTECNEEEDCGVGGVCIGSLPNPDTLPQPPANTAPQCNFTQPNFVTECFYSGTTFVQDAYAACQQRCATDPDLPPGEFCDWSVGLEWDGNPGALGTVLVSCGCGSGQGLLEGGVIMDIPDPQIPETYDDSYTDYAKACWNGTLCGPGKRGVEHCSVAEAACTCDCSP